eukprot:TRINITY_DN2476_c0_g2_i2.p1 TRINITY_DN2476_c0_g2~~TRINITY_DN2476_c0_g2_i2.p1  ORF type:complete len:103 (-),score=13.81 TRINITY_DN2476_c0_g2_i2:104-412(-)
MRSDGLNVFGCVGFRGAFGEWVEKNAVLEGNQMETDGDGDEEAKQFLTFPMNGFQRRLVHQEIRNKYGCSGWEVIGSTWKTDSCTNCRVSGLWKLEWMMRLE